MADKYQKDSKAASFKKHRGSDSKCWNLNVFIVAELNNVILEFMDLKTVAERLKYLLFSWSRTYTASEAHGY